jgi:hypothetical protein
VIKNSQIEELRNEAVIAGDDAQVAICDRALDGDNDTIESIKSTLIDATMEHGAVFDFETDRKLSGRMTRALAEASVLGSDGGGESARLVDGAWELVDASQVSTLRACGADVRAVYVAIR